MLNFTSSEEWDLYQISKAVLIYNFRPFPL
jgi:hypothetical protein